MRRRIRHEDEWSVPIKIKEGVFLSEYCVAKDLEFIECTKASHLLNVSGSELYTPADKLNFHYMLIESDCASFYKDPELKLLRKVQRFVAEAEEEGGSVLIVSKNGKSKVLAVGLAYLMAQFGWALVKAMQYLHAKRSNLHIKQRYYDSLAELESNLLQWYGHLSHDWTSYKSEEELLLINTHLNIKCQQIKSRSVRLGPPRVQWLDQIEKRNKAKLREKDKEKQKEKQREKEKEKEKIKQKGNKIKAKEKDTYKDKEKEKDKYSDIDKVKVKGYEIDKGFEKDKGFIYDKDKDKARELQRRIVKEHQPANIIQIIVNNYVTDPMPLGKVVPQKKKQKRSADARDYDAQKSKYSLEQKRSSGKLRTRQKVRQQASKSISKFQLAE